MTPLSDTQLLSTHKKIIYLYLIKPLHLTATKQFIESNLYNSLMSEFYFKFLFVVKVLVLAHAYILTQYALILDANEVQTDFKVTFFSFRV